MNRYPGPLPDTTQEQIYTPGTKLEVSTLRNPWAEDGWSKALQGKRGCSVRAYSLHRDLQPPLPPCWGSQISTSSDRRVEDLSLDELDGFWKESDMWCFYVKKSVNDLFSSNKTQSASTAILLSTDIAFNHFLNALCLTMNEQRLLTHLEKISNMKGRKWNSKHKRRRNNIWIPMYPLSQLQVTNILPI